VRKCLSSPGIFSLIASSAKTTTAAKSRTRRDMTVASLAGKKIDRLFWPLTNRCQKREGGLFSHSKFAQYRREETFLGEKVLLFPNSKGGKGPRPGEKKKANLTRGFFFSFGKSCDGEGSLKASFFSLSGSGSRLQLHRDQQVVGDVSLAMRARLRRRHGAALPGHGHGSGDGEVRPECTP